MRVAELIAGLGGAGPLADRLGLKKSAVGMWVTRGAVPREHHMAVWEMALASGLPWEPPGADAIRHLLGRPEGAAPAPKAA